MRSKWTMGAIAALFAILAAGSVYVQAQGETAKGKDMMITGEAVDLYCYIAKDMTGAAVKGCGDRTAKKNLPVGIVEQGTGQVYIAVFRYKRPAVNWPESANAELVPLLGSKVNARGTVYEKNGAKLIEINTISEAL